MKLYYIALASLVLLASCTKDPAGPDDAVAALPAAQGVYILHEGNFGDPSGARLALYDITRDTVSLDVVEGANGGQHLGSTGDDMLIFRDRLYTVMSGSENIVVLSLTDHHIVQSAYYSGTVPHALALDSVRGRLYATGLYGNAVMAVDLTTLKLVDSVSVGANPQEMLLVGNDLYVCNSGYGSDNRVSVLSVSPLALVKTIPVGAGPTGITRTSDGSIVVACTGNPYGIPVVPGSIYTIDAATRTVRDSVVMTEPLWGSISSGLHGEVYVLGVTSGSYYGGPVHRFVLSTRTVTASVVPGTFYGMAIDAASGDMYLADAKSFASQGEVRIVSSAFTAKRTLLVERCPSVFAFKR
jgi:hypothetical protein